MNKELRNWVLANIEGVTVFVMLTFPLWIVSYILYNLYTVIRDEIWEAVWKIQTSC
jgi:hypothetical protein